MSEQELKPCPCCGSSDLIRELAVNDRIWVKCTNCTMMGWAEDWNTRADHIPDASKMMWISVSDCLPDDDDVQVIIAFNYCGRVIVSTDYYDHDYDEWLGHEYNDVTHWMPLPEPPDV